MHGEGGILTHTFTYNFQFFQQRLVRQGGRQVTIGQQRNGIVDAYTVSFFNSLEYFGHMGIDKLKRQILDGSFGNITENGFLENVPFLEKGNGFVGI